MRALAAEAGAHSPKCVRSRITTLAFLQATRYSSISSPDSLDNPVEFEHVRSGCDPKIRRDIFGSRHDADAFGGTTDRDAVTLAQLYYVGNVAGIIFFFFFFFFFKKKKAIGRSLSSNTMRVTLSTRALGELSASFAHSTMFAIPAVRAVDRVCAMTISPWRNRSRLFLLG